MEKITQQEVNQQIKEALILFCKTEGYNACDVRDWVKKNDLRFKPKDTDKQIEDRVNYFVSNILKTNNYVRYV
jgi:hypothetical protein